MLHFKRETADRSDDQTQSDVLIAAESVSSLLLASADEQQQMLAGLAQDQQELSHKAIALVGELVDSLGWETETLVEVLGCTTRPWDGNDPNLTLRLQRTLNFVSLMLELGQEFDHQFDRRAIVVACCQLARTTGAEYETLAEALSVGRAARTYLMLGEFSLSMTLAEQEITGESAVSATGPFSPHNDDGVVHLSVPRMEMFVAGEVEALGGDRVFARIEEHVESCEGCSAVDRQIRQVIAAKPSF